MKITVNENCIGCGACTAIAPSVFDLNDDGVAIVINNEIKEEELKDAKDAIEGCPVNAIVEE